MRPINPSKRKGMRLPLLGLGGGNGLRQPGAARQQPCPYVCRVRGYGLLLEVINGLRALSVIGLKRILDLQ